MRKKKEQPIAETLPLVAIDFGTNSIRVMAAQRLSMDKLHILGVAESSRFSCIEKGVIKHSSNAGYMLSECLRLLGNQIGCKDLPTAFVSVGGFSTNCVQVHVQRDQIRSKLISKALLNEMEQECKQKMEKKYPNYVVLGVVPCYFVLDGESQDYPPDETQRAVKIEGYYDTFYADKDVDERLQKSFDQAGKSIEQTFLRQEALFSAFVAEDGVELMEKGCALIDCGADTTTLSIFKGNKYLCHKVFDKGGIYITRGIEEKGIPFPLAEKLKCQYGYISPDMVEKDVRYRVKASEAVGGTLSISTTELATIIQTRFDEMIEPVLKTLKEYAGQLKYVYITGGASMLCGMDEYLSNKTSMDVCYGGHDKLIDDERYEEPTYSALVGTLLLGADYREDHKGAKVPAPRSMQKIQDMLIDFFTEAEKNMNRE